MKHFNFIVGEVSERDIDLLFGPIDKNNQNDLIIKLDDDTQMENIWVEVGLFKSLSQARKNNHSGDIPFGWSHLKKKKRGFEVFIFRGLG